MRDLNNALVPSIALLFSSTLITHGRRTNFQITNYDYLYNVSSSFPDEADIQLFGK